MKSSDKTCKYAHLDRLSTPELEEILRADLAQPDSEDTDMVLYIMEVIEQRENKKTEESIAGTNRAWKEFQEIYNTPEGAGQSLYPGNRKTLFGNVVKKCIQCSRTSEKRNNIVKKFKYSASYFELYTKFTPNEKDFRCGFQISYEP